MHRSELISQQTRGLASVLNPLHASYQRKGIENPLLWSQLLGDYLSAGLPKQSLLVYVHHRLYRGHRQHSALPLVLKACAALSSLVLGRAFHAEAVKVGAVTSSVMVGTSLVSMYSKCSDVVGARRVFDEMPERNVVTWNAMIGGYSKNGNMGSASLLFEEMPERTAVSWAEMIDGCARIGETQSARRWFDRTPSRMKNVVTWTVMVDGYARNGEMDAARQVFEEMPQRNSYVWSSMVDGYCKKGDLVEARKLFDQIPVRNLVNWNAMIAGYAQNGFCNEALEAFRQMRSHALEPDEFTIASLLSACGQLGSLDTGKEIHELICRNRIKLNQFVLNGLVDMYSKCGDLPKAREIFEGLNHRNQVCWNSMISGLATHGESKQALELFRRMEATEAKPNEITFTALLSACAHGGFVDEGLEIFTKMTDNYGLAAGIEHYGCLVDLLGRVGRLEEAFDLVKKMPIEANDIIWGSLLGACKIHMDMEMAKRVVVEVGAPGPTADTTDDVSYVLLSNIYATSERWEEAKKMRMAMSEKKIQKIPGCSSIQFHSEIGAELHTLQIHG